MPVITLKSSVAAACTLICIACGDGGGATTASPEVPGTTSDGSVSENSPVEAPAQDTRESDVDPSDDGICNDVFDASDIPFLVATFPSSDACPTYRGNLAPQPSSTVTHVTRDEPGRICMSGEVTTGWAILIVSFDRINAVAATPAPETRQPFDSAALGATALRFTLDPAPANGLQVALSMVTGEGCTATTQDCIQADFYVMVEGRPGVPLAFDESGPQTLRIADFVPAPWADPTNTLDPTRLAGVQFELNPGAFDFCIRDFELLDASGTPITPPLE